MLWYSLARFPNLQNALGGFYDDLRLRDIVAAGAASGIATAFRAPIGGVVFVLEEAISFFDAGMIFRTYFTTVVAYFTLAVLIDGRTLNNRSFTDFDVQVDCDMGYVAEDILVFALLGVAGAVLGSLFNMLTLRVRALRSRFINSLGWRRLLEAAVIVVITSLFVVWLPLAGRCSPAERLIKHVDLPSLAEASSPIQKTPTVCLDSETQTFFYKTHNATVSRKVAAGFLEDEEYLRIRCAEGEYNELALLMYRSGDGAVTRLFQTGTYYLFSPDTLLIFLVVYFFLALITAGMSVPAGLVIPMLAIGGTLGRLFALGLNNLIKLPLGVKEVDPGSWALVGAAAFWCGSGGITVTIAIIMLEITGDFRQLPPIAIAVIVAKLVGEAINHGLYHSLIHLQHIPFLSDVPAESMDNYSVKDIMATPVVTFQEHETVQRVREVLGSTPHNGFPVLGEHLGRQILKGLVLRQHLLPLLPAGVVAPNATVRVVGFRWVERMETAEGLRKK